MLLPGSMPLARRPQPLTAMTDPVAIFNAVEAAWWVGLGIALLAVRVGPNTARLRWPMSAVLVLFGVSDLVEIWSGAWWRPWWLAAWKIACGASLAGLALLWYRRIRRYHSSIG